MIFEERSLEIKKGMDLFEDMGKGRAFVIALMNHWVSYDAGNVLTS